MSLDWRFSSCYISSSTFGRKLFFVVNLNSQINTASYDLDNRPSKSRFQNCLLSNSKQFRPILNFSVR
ncbi:unnamed protein product [Blepharisma stoltei]|uniref:Uncharacterized protein n=1 Tax=Blepharisma stoltei TaxID=1481888 RepID=A0AAU9J8U4_9CILI|nr:unnamed protein product [Blepharisma stoltei]